MISKYISKNARVTRKHKYSEIKWQTQYSEINVNKTNC